MANTAIKSSIHSFKFCLLFLEEELVSVKTFLATSQTEENKLKTQVAISFSND